MAYEVLSPVTSNTVKIKPNIAEMINAVGCDINLGMVKIPKL